MIIFPLYSFFFLLLILKNFFFFSFFFSLDLNLIFIVLVFPLVLFLIFNSLFNYIGTKEKFIHFFCFIIVILFLFFCFRSNFSFFFLVFLENCVVFMIFLIFWFSKDQDKISATFFIFFINIMPSIIFIWFCSDWSQTVFFFFFTPFQSNRFVCLICFLGLLLRKLPLFFFHFWLTKAHVRASGCGSMILASLLLKIGSIGLFKFYYIFLSTFLILGAESFSVVSLTMFILLVVIIRFFDLKYLVACSSIIHIAPLFPLTLIGDSFCIFRCFLISVGHGLVSYFIFYLVSIFYELGYNRSSDFNKSLGSFSGAALFFFICFLIFNLGFPPFARFIRELIFFFTFLNFRVSISSIFFLNLLLRGVVFFIVISKTIFGKKNIFNIQLFFSSLYTNSYIYLRFFLFIPFFYLYPFSLDSKYHLVEMKI